MASPDQERRLAPPADPPVQPAASILIPTLRAADYLDVTLRSVIPQARELEAEVIVVSDGPDSETETVTRGHGARLVALPHQQGLNFARNAGIRAARADLLIFIDQDVHAPQGWLEAYLEGAARTQEREVFGGPIRARLEGRALRLCGRESPPITTLDCGTTDRDVQRVWGANMAMRRSAFERVGVFDERLFGRGDEEEWEIRYLRSGHRIRYLAAAGIDHRRTPEDARLRSLAPAAFGQGREARRHDVYLGIAPPLRSEVRVLAGCAWHTVRRRCSGGIVMGATSAGRLREALRESRR